MDPIYPDFPTAPSIPRVERLAPDRLDPDQRHEQDGEARRRRHAKDEEEGDEAVVEDLHSDEEPAPKQGGDALRLRGDLRRNGDDDGHIDITV